MQQKGDIAHTSLPVTFSNPEKLRRSECSSPPIDPPTHSRRSVNEDGPESARRTAPNRPVQASSPPPPPPPPPDHPQTEGHHSSSTPYMHALSQTSSQDSSAQREYGSSTEQYGKRKDVRLQRSSGTGLRDGNSFGAAREHGNVVLLYGRPEARVYEAKNLPNMDLFVKTFTQCLTCCNRCGAKELNCAARGEEAVDRDARVHRRHPKLRTMITTDPYATVNIPGGVTLARTRVIRNSENPMWDECLPIHVAHFTSKVQFVVKDHDALGAEVIGYVTIPAETIVNVRALEGWYPIMGAANQVVKEGAQLRISVKYFPIEADPRYKDGVTGWAKNFQVSNTYFPLRKGNNVRLYQDTHVPKGMLPTIELEGQRHFEPRGYWDDLCQAILEAHHMVYIIGWSIYDKVRLIRDETTKLPDGTTNLTLGELLKLKSSEGVRVLLLVWDDKTSTSNLFFHITGVMGTHDEDTKNYFRHTAIRCLLSPRYGDDELSWLEKQTVGTLYTHHQKLVIVDTQAHGNNRKLTAFIGGIDICNGRYDTPRHSLFETLQTVHNEDYRNPTFSGSADAGGPRQPWHDLHCRVDGPAAYDALTNFEQCWRKTTRWYRDALLEIARISWILGPIKPGPNGDHELMVTKEDDPEIWHVQVFRSIDSGSVKGFPKQVLQAKQQNLVCRKDLVVEQSIQTAYIEVIRAAQHFLYIENQYFLGSSYAWPDYKNAGATHLVPMEIALKVASKVKAGERFAAYIVIPMWPEGVPTSATVQEILYFQGQTMKMMYRIVADALDLAKREVGLDANAHPKHYLNFYCLGNRETKKDIKEPPPSPPAVNTSQWHSQKNRRFMIYVHSKGMIVDDEYVILGSANINQRSMDGARDTEIAIGAYQPHHTWAKKRTKKFSHPRGQVYGYRMSLWAEHLGVLDDIFVDASSLDCVHRVNEMADEYLRQYTSDEIVDMKGHLLPYPIKVEMDGTVSILPEFESFPDVGGKVIGAPSQNLPDNLTT